MRNCWSLLLFVPSVVVLGRRPKIGIAINTGDRNDSIGRVRFSVGEEGWARPENFRAVNAEVDIAVYSSVKTGWMPWGSIDAHGNAKRCVPVIPCCSGLDLGQSLATAQKMREHTWALMLDDFSEDTEWFVSTEDDAWFNVTRLFGVIDNFKIMKGGNDPSNPMIISVGQFAREVWGAFVVFNRPVLRMLGNATLLGQCRNDFLRANKDTETRRFFLGKYPGTDYNLDQFLAYCLKSYFPRVAHNEFVQQHFFPIMKGEYRPNKFWYNGPSGWPKSQRAPELVASMTPQERRDFVGVHHVTIEDMAYLEKVNPGEEEPARNTADHCTAWINPSSRRARDSRPTDGFDVAANS